MSEKVKPETINFMITHAKGLVCPITQTRAEELQLDPMVRHNTDSHQTAFTVSIDHITNKTGISAPERADTISALVNSDSKASDFKRPGHISPLIAKEGGVLEREGHTKAAVDLAKLCGAYPSGIICEIIKEDGTMARLPDLQVFAETFNLKVITIADLIKYRKKYDEVLSGQ